MCSNIGKRILVWQAPRSRMVFFWCDPHFLRAKRSYSEDWRCAMSSTDPALKKFVSTWNLESWPGSWVELAVQLKSQLDGLSPRHFLRFCQKSNQDLQLRALVLLLDLGPCGLQRLPVRSRLKPRKCPRCGSADLAVYFYGMPSADWHLQLGSQSSRIILGGCGLSADAPLWHCTHCKKDLWGPLALQFGADPCWDYAQAPTLEDLLALLETQKVGEILIDAHLPLKDLKQIALACKGQGSRFKIQWAGNPDLAGLQARRLFKEILGSGPKKPRVMEG